jgi:serine/threonine-protein kinase
MATPGAAPARLGRYELIARLAAGGMGEIFLARLEGAAGFEKLFVIKRILPHLADDQRFRAMLIAEARIASMMAHANICQVYELGETDGQLYIVMEYLEGVTLLPLLRKLSKSGGSLELGFVAGVIQQATEALHYAHELRGRGGDSLGIVHRDVTPTNLFLTDAGVLKILDFGIAKVKDISANTQTGTVKGKYAYMAPEQLRGAGVDRRSDVFALGVVAYEMLALRRLFQRKTDYLTFRAVLEQPITDIRRYRTTCPDPLAAVLARALDRDPAVRYDTARLFGRAVVDAVAAVQRPWTQGEVSDFVRANFAAELSQRSAQIAAAVRTGAPRTTMPLLVQPSEETTEVDADTMEFGPVSSEVSETPVDVRHLQGPGRGGDGDASDATGEPTAVDRPASPPPPALDALRAVPPPPAPQIQPAPIVVVNRRSVLWPVIALAMLGIAGGALYQVWNRAPPQVNVMLKPDPNSRVDSDGGVVWVGPNDAAAADPSRGSSGAPDDLAAGAGSGSPAQVADPVESVRTPSKAEADARARKDREQKEREQKALDLKYARAAYAKVAEVNRCTARYGSPPPGATVVIHLEPDGSITRFTMEPKGLDATFAGCIQDAFRSARFPRGPDRYDLRVGLQTRTN